MAINDEIFKLGVLFVDDNQKILDLLKLDLRAAQDEYNFYFEQDPLHALERIKQGGIHIVFADFDMPQMDGLEWLKNVRSIDPMIVRLVITAFGDLGTTERFVENAEIFGFIKKPWKRDYLLGQLDQARSYFMSTHPNYDGDPWSVVVAMYGDDGSLEIECKYPGIAPFDAEVVAKKVFESFPDLFEDDFESSGYTLPLTYERVTVRCYFERIEGVDKVKGILFLKQNIESWQVQVIDEVYQSFREEVKTGGSDFHFIVHNMVDELMGKFVKSANN